MGSVKGILLGSFIILMLNQSQDETILWQKNQKLSWTDFKGKPENNRAAAVTASGLTYSFSTIKKNSNIVGIDFEVSSFFYPDKSWYHPKLCNSLILSHEQLHFVYAEKFRKRLANTIFSNNVKAEVKAIYNQINSELNDYQNLYDTETNFSRDTLQQILWNKKVDNLLNVTN